MTASGAVLANSSHLSLMHGWIPVSVQAGTAAVLVLAVGWRSPRWRRLWLPTAVAVGVAVAGWAHWYVTANGLSDGSAPGALWVWIALAAVAATVALLGWRSARWWRRGVSLLALPLCLLCAALALNVWVGYLPTVQVAWDQLAAGGLPNQSDLATVKAMAANGDVPRQGRIVAVTIPYTASGFKHRDELVYLPPAWFTTTPPPKLPTVLMIGAEFNTPADWLRIGDAAATIDDFAAAHGGNAPVFVFADSDGSFHNDTECVNGPRGNAADHLTKDVVPYLVSTFGVSLRAANWGVVGFSTGGTCAVDLTVMHPEVFSAFVDIAGDLSPNTGTKSQSIASLYGGSAAAWAAFDPTTVITKHGHYTRVSGWFDVNAGTTSDQLAAARSLCALGREHGIDCTVVARSGKHDWPFAARSFGIALPWLAGALDTPGVARTPLPAGMR